MTTDADRITRLEGQLQTALARENDQRLRAAPADQRPMLEREMALERGQQKLEADRATTNVAVLTMYRQSVSLETGIDLSKFGDLTSLAEIDQQARKLMTEQMADPKALREFADTLEKVKTPAQAAEAAAAAAPGAPGAEVAPAGVGGGATAAPATGAPGVADPLTEITERYKDKGQSSMAAWLAETRRLPQVEVTVGGGTAPVDPPPLPPAPAVVPAVVAPAPATPAPAVPAVAKAPAPAAPKVEAAPAAPATPAAPSPEPAPVGSS